MERANNEAEFCAPPLHRMLNISKDGSLGEDIMNGESTLVQSPNQSPEGFLDRHRRDAYHAPQRVQTRVPRGRQATFPVHYSLTQSSYFAVRENSVRSNGSSTRGDRFDRINQLARQLQERIPRPPRAPGKPPRLTDAVRYYLRIAWNRRLVAALNGVMNGSELCEPCHQLQLDTDSFLVRDKSGSRAGPDSGNFNPGSSTGRHVLGTLHMIASKSHWCSLCRLIVSSLREQPRFRWLQPDTLASNASLLDIDRDTELRGTKCYLSWQIDGRILSELSTNRKRKHTFLERGAYQPRTRRIRVEWDPPPAYAADQAIEPFYVVLVADIARQSWRDFLGQHVATRQSSTALIKSWLDRCSRDHSGSCDISPSTEALKILKQAYFGVIDLQDMRLTSLPEGARYVALSYTWGQAEIYRTLRSNVRSLQAHGGIERILGLLPQTMRDAMALARDLGERYFWVDAICIVQDSEATWQLNANVMDQIYHTAYLTICAADGTSARAGLVSYRDWQRSKTGQMQQRLGCDEIRPSFSQKIEYYSRRVQLMASYSAEAYINKSVWNERAWTFQERLLSRRCVIFVAGRVFFQCRSTVLREDIVATAPDGRSLEHRGTPLELLGDIEKRPLSVYIQCVELYTRRKLTKSKDILNAFQGVGNYIGKVLGSEGLLYGLPRSHFDWALLWQLKGVTGCSPHFRGKQNEDNGVIEDFPHEFPTWSWCGWYGDQAQYRAHMIDGTMANVCDWLTNHTWIVWYVRDGHGNLTLVQDSRRNLPQSLSRLQGKWAGYSCTKSPPVMNEHDPYGRGIDGELRKGQPEKFTLTLDEFPFQVSISGKGSESHVAGKNDLNLTDMRFLQFFSLSAHFSLKHFEPFLDDALSSSPLQHTQEYRWGIVDYKGDIWGVVTPDRDSWRRGRDSLVNLAEGTHRFIAISEAKEFSREEIHGWDDYVSHETEGTEWDIYYVLLVKEIDNVCYRLGLGKVYKEAFLHSCDGEAEWREFILG